MTVQEYLNQRENIVKQQPKTRRVLQTLIAKAVKDNEASFIAVGGLRKVGKTTLLKQLYEDVANSFYITFEYAQDTQTAASVEEHILWLISEKKVSLLLLDEVTRPYAYDDMLRGIVKEAINNGIPVVATSSSRYYLKHSLKAVLGARYLYVELRPVTFYEYMSVFKDMDEVARIDMTELTDILNVCNKISDVGCTEEVFNDYLRFLASMRFTGDISTYIEDSYDDLLKSDQGVLTTKFNYPSNYDIGVAAALLRATQYRLTSVNSSMQDFYDFVSEYKREFAMHRRNLQFKQADIQKFDTSLQQAVDVIKRAGSAGRTNALAVLAGTGIIAPVFKRVASLVDDYTDMNNAFEFYDGWTGSSLAIPNDEVIASEINIYCCLLRELLNHVGISGDFVEYIQGYIRGELLEYYITSQAIALSRGGYVDKLIFGPQDRKEPADKYSNMDDLKGEIDIYAKDIGMLIEVGTKKSRSNLVFCRSDFDTRYPNLALLKRVCVTADSAIGFDGIYYRVPYYIFGSYLDMVYLKNQADVLGVSVVNECKGRHYVESAERELDALLEEYKRIASE